MHFEINFRHKRLQLKSSLYEQNNPHEFRGIK